MLTRLHAHFLNDAHSIVTNVDGTPNWLGCVGILAAVVVIPGLLAGKLSGHAPVGIITSAIILVAIVTALFFLASALKGFD